MAKFIDAMIDEIREQTENEEFNTALGLSEEEFIRYLNDAQYRIHAKIVQQHPMAFTAEKEITIVADQQAYSVPSLAFISNRISSVEYSHNGDAENYYPLQPGYYRNRFPGAKGDPDFYIRRSGELLITPIPNTTGGTLRVTYVKKPRRLDKRRGLIKAVTTSGSNITNLEINYVNGATVDSAELNKNTRFTVVDKYGNIKMDNVLLSSIDSSTTYDATLAVDSSFAFDTGETISVNDYVVAGTYTSTHFDMEDSLERYVRAYAIWKTFKRDSSVDANEAGTEVAAMERDIIDTYEEMSDDIQEIPVINRDEEWF